MKDFRARHISGTLLFFLLGSFCGGKVCLEPVHAINFEMFCSELRTFIKYSRAESPYHGEHNVYLVKFTESNTLEACITMAYIFSRSQFVSKLENFDYFTLLDSNLVLINVNEKFRDKYDFKDERIVSMKDTIDITKRLCKEVFFGDGSVAVSCFGPYNIARNTYSDYSLLPHDKQLFERQNSGIIRKVDSTSFGTKRKNR